MRVTGTKWASLDNTEAEHTHFIGHRAFSKDGHLCGYSDPLRGR